MVTVSVVIPCYNQGHLIDEAINSVLSSSYQDLEIVVVNDGSSDGATNTILGNYTRDGVQIITTENQGLAAARNSGIAAASGRYILPLDADDKIGADYIKEAVRVLDRDPEVGIVYCRARLFGASDTDWKLPDYSLEGMLIDNIIFCSALFRRADWQLVGGYDPAMIYGWEDYDLWLSLIERGRRVVRLDTTGFFYRVASDSMVRSREKWQKVAMFKRIYQKHLELFSENIEVWIERLVETRERYYTSRLYVDCGQGVSDAMSVARKIEPGTRRIDFDLRRFPPILAIRLDPVDAPAVLLLEDVTLSYGDGSTIRVEQIQSNALYEEGRLFYFDGNDPQWFFPGLSQEKLKDIEAVSVGLSFEALGVQAVESILQFQKDALADSDVPLAIRLKNSLMGIRRGRQ